MSIFKFQIISQSFYSLYSKISDTTLFAFHVLDEVLRTSKKLPSEVQRIIATDEYKDIHGFMTSILTKLKKERSNLTQILE